MMVDLASKIGIVLLRRLEHDLRAIRELVSGEVDLAEAAFPNQTTKRVVADGLEVNGGEFSQEGLVRVGELENLAISIRLLRGLGEGRSVLPHLIALFLCFILGLSPDRWH